MDGVRDRNASPISLGLEGAMVVEVDTALYALAAVFRACYKLTDRCYFFLARAEDNPGAILVHISPKQPDANLRQYLGEFCNELLDQQIRETLSREAGALRDLIAAQAFAEGNLLDSQRDEGDYETDPRSIGSRR